MGYGFVVLALLGVAPPASSPGLLMTFVHAVLRNQINLYITPQHLPAGRCDQISLYDPNITFVRFTLQPQPADRCDQINLEDLNIFFVRFTPNIKQLAGVIKLTLRI